MWSPPLIKTAPRYCLIAITVDHSLILPTGHSSLASHSKLCKATLSPLAKGADLLKVNVLPLARKTAFEKNSGGTVKCAATNKKLGRARHRIETAMFKTPSAVLWGQSMVYIRAQGQVSNTTLATRFPTYSSSSSQTVHLEACPRIDLTRQTTGVTRTTRPAHWSGIFASYGNDSVKCTGGGTDGSGNNLDRSR
jgi:hypothetical protein